MFKVSFKEKDNCPSKIVEKAGRVTTVMYKGSVALPKFWWYLPHEITEWMKMRESVELYENVASNELTIFARGRTRCAEGDAYDSMLGERIAEAKAKMVIYGFFAGLCQKIFNYYNNLLTGDDYKYLPGTEKGIVGDIKKYHRLCEIEREHINKLLNNGSE